MMSDRRPTKLYDPEAAALWWNAEGRHLSIVELHEAVTDPVAAVRRGVESGTIKGEVVMWCESHDAEAYVEDYKAGVPVAHECWNSVYGWRLEDDCFIGARVLLGPVDEGDTQ